MDNVKITFEYMYKVMHNKRKINKMLKSYLVAHIIEPRHVISKKCGILR